MARPKKAPKKAPGRPQKEINPAHVEGLARLHCTHAEIAAVVGCSTDTLVRRFADLIEKAREQGKSSLRRMQWKKALDGDKTMLIWLGKQHLGQSDKQDVVTHNATLEEMLRDVEAAAPDAADTGS